MDVLSKIIKVLICKEIAFILLHLMDDNKRTIKCFIKLNRLRKLNIYLSRNNLFVDPYAD